MLRSNVILRRCVRAIYHPPTLLPTTRPVFRSILQPWYVQQRLGSHLRRLLDSGFNSLRGRKRTATKKRSRIKVALTSKIPSKSKALSPSRPSLRRYEKGDTVKSKTTPVQAHARPASSSTGKPHHDLRSFDEWMLRTNADPSSPTNVGTRYEYTVLKSLKQYGFTLGRRGGPNDEGIDLEGDLMLPPPRRALKVLIQCKVSRPTSAIARELEGACSGGRTDWRGGDVMAWLASPKPATEKTWEVIHRSPRPMGFALIDEHGAVKALDWNEVANEAGMESLTKKNMYNRTRTTTGTTGRVTRNVVLVANGEPWPKDFESLR